MAGMKTGLGGAPLRPFACDFTSFVTASQIASMFVAKPRCSRAPLARL
jgi:hypothetical protein